MLHGMVKKMEGAVRRSLPTALPVNPGEATPPFTSPPLDPRSQNEGETQRETLLLHTAVLIVCLLFCFNLTIEADFRLK